MRVVLDTKVLIAAFATRGLCEDVLRTVLAEHELVVSGHILAELERVLTEKLRMSTVRARSVVEFVGDSALVVEPTEPASSPENDVDDRWIVAAALAAAAQVIVSGDNDLLTGQTADQIPVVSPRGFWEKLR